MIPAVTIVSLALSVGNWLAGSAVMTKTRP